MRRILIAAIAACAASMATAASAAPVGDALPPAVAQQLDGRAIEFTASAAKRERSVPCWVSLYGVARQLGVRSSGALTMVIWPILMALRLVPIGSFWALAIWWMSRCRCLVQCVAVRDCAWLKPATCLKFWTA